MDIRTLEPALSTVATVSELITLFNFSFHCQRILKISPLNFVSPEIHANFWPQIISELLEIGGMSISRISEATDVPANTIYELKWNDLQKIELSLEMAKKLLVLHGEIRADLQPKLNINPFYQKVVV